MNKHQLSALHTIAADLRTRLGKAVHLDIYYAKDGSVDITFCLADYTFAHRWQKGDTPTSYLASLETRIAHLTNTHNTDPPNEN